jgi:hypothetical protein
MLSLACAVGPGVALWERLVGRLAARRAYQRIKLLLYWLQVRWG